MIPWPIALLSILYGVLTAVSGAALWRGVQAGVSPAHSGWASLLFVVSACAMAGLALMRPWARTLAIGASWAGMGFLLSLAAVCVLLGQPGAAVVATVGAGVHAAIIRYLGRPVVKAWFVSGDEETE